MTHQLPKPGKVEQAFLGHPEDVELIQVPAILSAGLIPICCYVLTFQLCTALPVRLVLSFRFISSRKLASISSLSSTEKSPLRVSLNKQASWMVTLRNSQSIYFPTISSMGTNIKLVFSFQFIELRKVRRYLNEGNFAVKFFLFTHRNHVSGALSNHTIDQDIVH